MFNFWQHIWDAKGELGAKGQGAFVPRKLCCPLGISVGESVDTGQYGRQHSSVPASGAKIEAVIFLSHWERKKEKKCISFLSEGCVMCTQDKNNFIQFLTSFEVSEQTDSEDLRGPPG